jgi:FtsZ-binding cell division protein ZapB
MSILRHSGREIESLKDERSKLEQEIKTLRDRETLLQMELSAVKSENKYLQEQLKIYNSGVSDNLNELVGEVITFEILEFFDNLIKVRLESGIEAYCTAFNIPNLAAYIKVGARMYAQLDDVDGFEYGLPLLRLSIASKNILPAIIKEENPYISAVCCKRIAGVYSNILTSRRLPKATIERLKKLLHERIDIVPVSEGEFNSCESEEDYKALFASKRKKRKHKVKSDLPLFPEE